MSDVVTAGEMRELWQQMVKFLKGTSYVGYSTGEKPVIDYYEPGMTITFFELDTETVWIYNGSGWMVL